MSKPSRRSAGSGPNRRPSAPAAGASASTTGPGRRSTSPSGTTRAGRRERVRVYDQPSFLERYRTRLLALAGVVVVALIAVFVFFSATAPSYACSTEWSPAPTASPAPGATQQLGYVQQDMGRSHNVASPQRYLLCPPASGPHLNRVGQGPIEAIVYGPNDYAPPQGWIHNLEHGGLVVLYNCTEGVQTDACTDSGQQAFKQFLANFPNSPICGLPKGVVGPVMARFDQMKWPYAAIVWNRVLPLETFDQAQILEFFQQFGDRTNPERQCPLPSPSASPGESGSVAPSESASPEASASPS